MNEIEKAEEKYQKFILRFTTCDLLEFFSKRSIEAYQNKERGFTKNLAYGQWELVQVCY